MIQSVVLLPMHQRLALLETVKHGVHEAGLRGFFIKTATADVVQLHVRQERRGSDRVAILSPPC